MPEVKSTDSRVNATGGRVWVDVGDKTDRERGLQELAGDLRGRLKALVGAEYVVLDDLNNGARKPVQIQFYGTDSRKLMELTNQFMDKMRQIPGAVDVGLSEQDPKDELRIELDRGLANQLGISVNDAAQTLRVAFAGVEVGDWVDPTGESRDVAVRLSPEDRLDASNIEHLPIAVAGTNMMVPLEQIATITIDKGPARIQHYNGKRTVTVSANVQGVDAGTVSTTAKKMADAMEFPAGFGVGLGGASRDQNELFAEMGIALLMGIFVMYLVLVMQFGSFTAPLAIMLSLLFSLIGVVLALNLTGGSLNLMSLIGVIMLMGLVAKNAILLLDCAREEERQGIDREEALMHAGRVRLRPILMTTFALMAGMMPVAIGVGEGGEFYSPDGGGDHRRHHRVDDADAARRAELLRQHRDRARARWPSSSTRERPTAIRSWRSSTTLVEALVTLVVHPLLLSRGALGARPQYAGGTSGGARRAARRACGAARFRRAPQALAARGIPAR